MVLSKCDEGYLVDGTPVTKDGLLEHVMRLDDERGGSFTLSADENEALSRLFAEYV